jgi:hypothetical protein
VTPLVGRIWPAALASSFALLVACSDEERSHVYGGRQYEPARGCLDGTTAIDVVEGPLPAAPCDPRCLVARPDDAGVRAIYVSTMCAPLPPAYDATGTAPECPAAVAAYVRNDTCLEDGGTTHPLDAGVD